MNYFSQNNDYSCLVAVSSAHTIDVRNLHKRYKNGVWGNKNITFFANPGEIMAFLGPNGAGKTTLVRQMTTELIPTSGRIYILGNDAVDNPRLAKSALGIVPQDVDLFDYLTVHQHLRIFAKLRGLRGKAANMRASELLGDLGLDKYSHTEIKKLSGGLKRRLLIGIAALANPPIMILDEPTTGLDPESRKDVWEFLKVYRNNGSTVVLTTHYMEEAEELSDRVGIIKEGEFLALDTITQLRSDYGYEYKITFKEGLPNNTNILYGSDYTQLVQRVTNRGISEFSIAQTSLEDIYLDLMNRPKVDE